jgi:hypothetical protein
MTHTSKRRGAAAIITAIALSLTFSGCDGVDRDSDAYRAGWRGGQTIFDGRLTAERCADRSFMPRDMTSHDASNWVAGCREGFRNREEVFGRRRG